MPNKRLKDTVTKKLVLVSEVEKLKRLLRERAEKPLTIDGEARSLVCAMIDELKAARDAGHSLESIRMLFLSFGIEITIDDLTNEIDREIKRLVRGHQTSSSETVPAFAKRKYTKRDKHDESGQAAPELFNAQS